MKAISCFIIAACMSGCGHSGEKWQNELWEENKKSVNNCRDRGGVPIASTWNGMLSQCQFAPK